MPKSHFFLAILDRGGVQLTPESQPFVLGLKSKRRDWSSGEREVRVPDIDRSVFGLLSITSIPFSFLISSFDGNR